MGRLIVTDTRLVKNPYRMKETGHLLYSYEELCYYIKSRMQLWLLETERKGLTDWIRKTGVEIEETDSLTPTQAAEKILRAGRYFKPEETDQLLDQMTGQEGEESRFLEKEKGDIYLSYGKLKKAYFSYQSAAGQVHPDDDASFLASLYHNMALILCRFFYWEEAEKWLLLALSYEEENESEKALAFVREMKEKTWETGENPMLSIEVERKKKEFLMELGE
jgi:tetratricopeptide (TPR) repeat protein